MASNDNEWGISDVNASDDNSKQFSDQDEYGDAMPAKEITANLSEAMSSEIVENAVVRGIVTDDDIRELSGLDEIDGIDDISDQEILGETGHKEIVGERINRTVRSSNPAEVVHHKKRNNPKPVRTVPDSSDDEKYDEKYEEKDEEEELGDNKFFIIAMAVIGVIIIIILGILLLSLGGKKNKDTLPEEDDYEIVDIRDDNNSSGDKVPVKDDSNQNTDNNKDSETGTEKDDSDNNVEVTECDKNGHVYADATCTKAKTCKVCGQTSGDPLGHDFSDASCDKEAICKICGEKGTSSLGHNFTPATCTEPKTCSRCKLTEGEPLGHDYEEATCEAPATCKRCKETTGEKTDHSYEEVSSSTADGVKTINYKCKFCGNEKTEKEDVSKPASSDEYANQVIDLVNREREANGLKPLTSTPELMDAARVRASEISTSFSHTRPDGSSCFTILEQKGVPYNSCGENIAAGQSSPDSVHLSWMNSDGHRDNILNAGYNHIGVGFYSGGTYGYYWVQLFTN